MPVYQFGGCELDSRSGELRRHGCRVRLRPQPAAVLQYMLERAGLLVSRQELQRLLWPDGTFVAFDDGLNSCIKQIRAALRDDRMAPRYLETLSRRGYRLVAPVHAAQDGEADARPRVVVVPFQCLMPAEPIREIAEGLTEEVITQLTIAGRRGGLSVVARPVDTHGDLGASRPGHADFALTGSVRLSSPRFRIAVQLISVRDHEHAWAAMFDGAMDDVLGAQARIAAAIVSGVLRTLVNEATDTFGRSRDRTSLTA